MKAFVITLRDHKYSEQCADRCISTANHHGLNVEKFYGVDKEHANATMEEHGLKWTWAKNNTRKMTCPHTGLGHFPYTNKDLRTKIGCSMSHFLLWKHCVELDENVVILEHDAVFVHDFPHDIKFRGICQINDPRGATPGGIKWSNIMVQRGTEGAHRKTRMVPKNSMHPDGLAGNSAYILEPWAAQELIDRFKDLGIWPNDATMCIQLFPYLQEYYPFITEVRQSRSTTEA